MTRRIVIINRIVSAVFGALVGAVSLVALGYQAGWRWSHEVIARFDPDQLLAMTTETWWTRAVFGLSVLAILIGALLLGLALWPDRIGPVSLDPDHSSGHLTIDLRALASAVARDIETRLPAAQEVRAHPFLDRGVPTIRLTVVIPGNADLRRASEAVAESISDIVVALEGAPIAIPVFYEVPRNAARVRN